MNTALAEPVNCLLTNLVWNTNNNKLTFQPLKLCIHPKWHDGELLPKKYFLTEFWNIELPFSHERADLTEQSSNSDKKKGSKK